MKWEPIETAPKDGTEIIVSRASENGKAPDYAHVAWWSAYKGNGEWTLVNTGDYAASSDIYFKPTHWSRLEPPQ